MGGTTILKLVQSVHAADLEQCSVKCFGTGWNLIWCCQLAGKVEGLFYQEPV